MKIADSVWHRDYPDLGRGRIESPIASLMPPGVGPIRRRWRVRFGGALRVCWEDDLRAQPPAPMASAPALRVVPEIVA